jgi:DNA-binding MarR family transcriptional regulator/GNAT superfamily N-acetyltransferase
MADTLDRDVAAVRRFSRFYTRHLGVLEEGLLGSRYPLTEARVIYELGRSGATTASALGRALDLDPGYLSRIVKRFEQDGLITRRVSDTDARQSRIELTAAGASAFAELDQGSRRQIARWLEPIDGASRRRLTSAMATVENLLDIKRRRGPRVELRPSRAGDMGWIVQRHGELYAAEYGWDERFEALVARVVADFIERHEPARERAWLAELDGERLGSVLLVRSAEAGEAKLRLLLVEPQARGLGLGKRLVGECVAFARAAGYRRVVLWTNSILVAARTIYQRHGFELIRSEPHESFGHALVGETWALDLER